MVVDGMESTVYRMPAGKFAWVMMLCFGRRWLAGAAIALLLSVGVALIFDARVLILTLALVLIGIPSMLIYLYYYYGLNPECFVNIMPHSVVATGDGLLVKMLKSKPAGEDEDGEAGEKIKEDKEDEAEIVTYHFGRERLGRYWVMDKSIVLPLTAPNRGFIWIPENAYDSPEEFAEAVKKMTQNIV